MNSIRNIVFLVLTAGLGIGAYLMVHGPFLRGADVAADQPSMTIVTTSGPNASEPRTSEAGGNDRDLVAVDPVPDERGAQSFGGDNVGSTVIWPLELELSLAIDGRVEIPEGAQPIKWGATAGLKGSVLGAGGRSVGATVDFLYGPNEGRALQTDGRGRFGASNLLPGISVVRITTADGQTVEREVALTSRTQRDFHISFSGTSFISGTVKDEKAAVVEGAEVRLDGKLTFTNQDGEFTFSGVPGGSAHVTVQKEGYARSSQNVGVGYRQTVIPKNFVIFLEKGGDLQISVNRSVGAAEASLAYLMPASGPGRRSDGRSFPWHEVNPVKIPAGGSAVVKMLPQGSVSVRLFHRGAVPSPESKNVRIHPGRANAVAIDLKPAPTFQGVVMDDGEPAGGARVEIEASDRSQATSRAMKQKGPYFAMEMVVPTVPAAYSETVTDAKGQFFFTNLPGLITTYYATATSRDGKKRGVTVIAPGEQSLFIQLKKIEEDAGTLEVELPGRFQGLPVEVMINGKPADPFMLRPGMPLLLEDLPTGHWDVRAKWRGAEVIPRQVIQIGTEPAVVEGSLPGGAVQGQTEDERSRALKAHEIAPEAYAPRAR
ncbi:MAG: hypothetical protein ACJAZN_002010 [Planctomycetota bacterium]|jgi:hypothetical protein